MKKGINQGIARALINYQEIEIDPKCLNGQQEAFAITNRGELIPCCWLDTGHQRKQEAYMKLVWASNIADYDSIEEILLQDEWIEFYENLKKGRGFSICHLVCKKRETPQHKKMTILNDDGGDKYVKET